MRTDQPVRFPFSCLGMAIRNQPAFGPPNAGICWDSWPFRIPAGKPNWKRSQPVSFPSFPRRLTPPPRPSCAQFPFLPTHPQRRRPALATASPVLRGANQPPAGIHSEPPATTLAVPARLSPPFPPRPEESVTRLRHGYFCSNNSPAAAPLSNPCQPQPAHKILASANGCTNSAASSPPE
jgi:hypothetical protein